MKILASTVYFRGQQPNQTYISQNQVHRSSQHQTEEHGDSYTSSHTSKSQKKRNNTRVKIAALLSAITLLFSGGAITGAEIVNNYNEKCPSFPNVYHCTIGELAENFDIPVNILADVNNASADSSPEKIKLATPYTKVEDQIQKYATKLNDENISEKDKAKYEAKISQLRKRLSLQEELGVEAYQYDNKVYFYFTKGCNAETFKEAYGVNKDGLIPREYLSGYEWRRDNDEGHAYRDYTNADIIQGASFDLKVSNLE